MKSCSSKLCYRLAITLILPFCDLPAMAADLISEAVALQSDARDHEAIQLFNKVLANPSQRVNHPYVHLRRGISWQACKQPEKAVNDYTQSIEGSPRNLNTAGIYSLRSRAYLQIGNAQRAIDDLNSALKLGPKNGNFWADRGEIYLGEKQFPCAIRDFSEALKCGLKLERRGKILTDRASAYEKSGQHALAERDRREIRSIEQEYELKR